MLPRVRFPSRLTPRAALRTLRRLPRPSRRLAVSSTLFPVAVLVALALAKGGPAEGQRAPGTATASPHVTVPVIPGFPTPPPDCIVPPPRSIGEQLLPEYYALRVRAECNLQARERLPRTPTPTPAPTLPPEDPALPRPGETKAGDGWISHSCATGERVRTAMPIFSKEYAFYSIWTMRVGSNFMVYSGESKSDPTEGILLVFKNAAFTRAWSPPPGAGRLCIVGAVGRRLILTAANGAVFQFDVEQMIPVEP